MDSENDKTSSTESKRKPVRGEAIPPKSFFSKNDFSYVDGIVDPCRECRAGPKGYHPSAVFMALLLMYLSGMESILELIRFLSSNREWLLTLGLCRNTGGRTTYMVPDRSTFYKFAGRVGVEGIIETMQTVVSRLVSAGIITGGKVSLDASIIQAWFRDCKSVNNPEHRYRRCRRHRHRDRQASWTWDHHKHMYIFGFKVHVLIDCLTGLPLALRVTKGGFGESRTVRYFVDAAVKLSLRVDMFLADAGYDTYAARRCIIGTLKAVPLIAFNPRGTKGRKAETRMKRCRKRRLRWYIMNGLTKWWADTQSDEFNSDYDARTFSEQVFSIGKGSLRLDGLKHKGIEWATLHAACICIVMLGTANTAVSIGRPDLMRCTKNFQC